MDPTLALLAALAAALVGGLAAWFAARGRTQALADSAAATARAALQVEVATLAERLRAAEAEARQSREALACAERDAAQRRDALDTASNDIARLEERASRVAVLEAARLEAQQRADDLAQQLATLRATLAAQLAELQAGARAQAEEGTRLRRELEDAQARLDEARLRGAGLGEQMIELQTRTDQERQGYQEQLRLLQDAKTALGDQFRNLANEILEEQSRRFAEQNQANLGTLLEPLKTRLAEFQGKVEEVYVQESKDRTALQEQVRQLMSLNRDLSDDARNLTLALKGSAKAQGNWGELVLERVLEVSGLRRGIEYLVQDARQRDDGTRAMPDVVILLPEDRRLVVDAKVSLLAYERHVSAASDADRAAALRAHLDSVRAHIRGLSDKRYQELYGLKTLDFVLAFVPIEPAFMLAVTNDETLFDDAWSRNVLLVSPSTLLFVVRTVAHLWRQEAQSRNAQDIARRGAEFYDKLCGFVEDLEKVGERLRQAQEAYAGAHNKLSSGRGNVIRQAEMLRELGVKPAKALPSALVEAAGPAATSSLAAGPAGGPGGEPAS